MQKEEWGTFEFSSNRQEEGFLTGTFDIINTDTWRLNTFQGLKTTVSSSKSEFCSSKKSIKHTQKNNSLVFVLAAADSWERLHAPAAVDVGAAAPEPSEPRQTQVRAAAVVGAVVIDWTGTWRNREKIKDRK